MHQRALANVAGQAANGEVYNETVYFIASIYEGELSLADFIQQQLDAGANPALALSLVHVALHELLGAIETYRCRQAASYPQFVLTMS